MGPPTSVGSALRRRVTFAHVPFDFALATGGWPLAVGGSPESLASQAAKPCAMVGSPPCSVSLARGGQDRAPPRNTGVEPAGEEEGGFAWRRGRECMHLSPECEQLVRARCRLD